VTGLYGIFCMLLCAANLGGTLALPQFDTAASFTWPRFIKESR